MSLSVSPLKTVIFYTIKFYNMQITLFTLETGANTYFIDYDEERTDVNPYSVFKNEKFCSSFKTYGEALQVIFDRQENINFYSQKAVDKMKKRAAAQC